MNKQVDLIEMENYVKKYSKYGRMGVKYADFLCSFKRATKNGRK